MNPSITIFIPISKKNTCTSVLIPALFLALALGLAGCDAPAGMSEQGESERHEISKADQKNSDDFIYREIGGSFFGPDLNFINNNGQAVGTQNYYDYIQAFV